MPNSFVAVLVQTVVNNYVINKNNTEILNLYCWRYCIYVFIFWLESINLPHAGNLKFSKYFEIELYCY
jgi:hypothetical protein